jgi:hypothetical protein
VRAGIEQRLLDAVEHLGGAVLGQFDLDLLPPGDAGRGSKGLAGDPVVGDRGEGPAVAVSQRPLLAGGVELDHRSQWCPAMRDAGQCHQRGWWCTEAFVRQANLVAGVRAGGKLQMPAVVMAAGPASERDPRAGQPQVLGVEVHGRQSELCRFPRWSCSPLRGPRRRRRQCHDKIDVDRLA